RSVEVSLSPTAGTAEQARGALELFERYGDRSGAAFSKLLLAFTELQRVGPGEDGAPLLEEAGATFVELGDPWGEAFAGRARFSFESYHRGCRRRRSRRGSGPWRSSGPSATSGGWPRPAAACPRSPRAAGTWTGRGPRLCGSRLGTVIR